LAQESHPVFENEFCCSPAYEIEERGAKVLKVVSSGTGFIRLMGSGLWGVGTYETQPRGSRTMVAATIIPVSRKMFTVFLPRIEYDCLHRAVNISHLSSFKNLCFKIYIPEKKETLPRESVSLVFIVLLVYFRAMRLRVIPATDTSPIPTKIIVPGSGMVIVPRTKSSPMPASA